MMTIATTKRPPRRYDSRGARNSRVAREWRPVGAERWRTFSPDELQALAEALRWRASQLRAFVALADAMAGAPLDEGEEGEDDAAEAARAHAALDVLERLLAEIAAG